MNEKQETYYKAYDGYKSTIDITLAIILISPVIKWSNEYNFRGSDHFPIILNNERKCPLKTAQIGHKESKVCTISEKRHNNKTKNQ